MDGFWRKGALCAVLKSICPFFASEVGQPSVFLRSCGDCSASSTAMSVIPAEAAAAHPTVAAPAAVRGAGSAEKRAQPRRVMGDGVGRAGVEGV